MTETCETARSKWCCRTCFKELRTEDDWPIMFLCPTCGNKRCPKATNHELPCSGSNAPGQEGSAYAHQPKEVNNAE